MLKKKYWILRKKVNVLTIKFSKVLSGPETCYLVRAARERSCLGPKGAIWSAQCEEGAVW